MRRRSTLALLLCGLSLACARAEFGRDGEALHYGSRAATAAAYGYGSDEAPFRRLPPEPWPLGYHPKPLNPDMFTFQQAAPVVQELPMPAEVVSLCEHVLGLIASAPSETISGQGQLTASACQLLLRTELVVRTAAQRQATADCIRASKAVDEADRCTDTHASPLDQASGGARERLVCKHIVAITVLEELGPEIELGADELGDLIPVVQDCVDDLGVTQGEDPAAYQALLDCLLASNSSAGFDRCEGRD